MSSLKTRQHKPWIVLSLSHLAFQRFELALALTLWYVLARFHFLDFSLLLCPLWASLAIFWACNFQAKSIWGTQALSQLSQSKLQDRWPTLPCKSFTIDESWLWPAPQQNLDCLLQLHPLLSKVQWWENFPTKVKLSLSQSLSAKCCLR